MLAMQSGEVASAIERFQQAVVIAPTDAAYHSHLGVALAKAGRIDDAIACFRQAALVNPALAEAHYNWGNALRSARRFEEAAIQYRTAIALSSTLHKRTTILPTTLRDLGRLDESILAYREAIRARPRYLPAHVNLGCLLKEQQRFAEAEIVFREIVRLSPGYEEGHYNLADTLAKQRMLVAAEANYRAALAGRPDFPAARSGLFGALTEQGKLDEALACLPALGGERESLENQLRLAEKLRLQRRFSDATACIQNVLRHGEIPEAYNNLGLIRTSEGRLEEAVAAFRRALELKPDFVDALNNLGVAFGFKDDSVTAIERFRDALRIRPDFATAHLNQAVTWLRQGDFERGWQEFEWRRLCANHRVQPMFCAPLAGTTDSPGHRAVACRARAGRYDPFRPVCPPGPAVLQSGRCPMSHGSQEASQENSRHRRTPDARRPLAST